MANSEHPPATSETRAPIPAEQSPGHEPDENQDQPDLDAMADRLGVVAEGDEPVDEEPVHERIKSRQKKAAVGAGVTTFAFLAALFLRRRRR